MSKDLFFAMREQEVITENFLPTKKEVKLNAELLVKQILDDGMTDKTELFVQAQRLNDFITEIYNNLKKSMPDENFEAYGIKGTFKNGGDMPNFKDDSYWVNIKKQLTEREALLKLALKSDKTIYDDEGVEVLKVSTTPKKSSLTINY